MKDKKDLLGGVIIVSLLLLVLVTYMTFYNYNKQEEKNKEEQKLKDNSLNMINIYNDYSFLKVESKDKIDTSKTLIGSYNCKADDCEVYKENIFEEKYIVLKENEDVFIYDFTLNKIVSNLYDDLGDEIKDNYYITLKDGKHGVISKSGVEIITSSYDEIYVNDTYDSIVKIKNNKSYGVIDLDNGSLIIEPKYENIKLTDSKYYSILKDNLWYVIDLEGNVLTNGYEFVYAFSKGFIALVGDNLKFFKYGAEEDLLIENSIPIYDKNDFDISRSGSTISINVKNQDVIIKYQYIINRNSLINK